MPGSNPDFDAIREAQKRAIERQIQEEIDDENRLVERIAQRVVELLGSNGRPECPDHPTPPGTNYSYRVRGDGTHVCKVCAKPLKIPIMRDVV